MGRLDHIGTKEGRISTLGGLWLDGETYHPVDSTPVDDLTLVLTISKNKVIVAGDLWVLGLDATDPLWDELGPLDRPFGDWVL
jgi:hypothetical protein